jgi:hypothetical protein
VSRLGNSDVALALSAIGCGGLALLAASGAFPAEMANGTPVWVLGLVGVVFVIGGSMIFLRNHSRALDLFAAMLTAAFTLIAGWVTLYGSAVTMSGGIPLLPDKVNVSIARLMFGLGTLLCFAAFLYALERFFDAHK